MTSVPRTLTLLLAVALAPALATSAGACKSDSSPNKAADSVPTKSADGSKSADGKKETATAPSEDNAGAGQGVATFSVEQTCNDPCLRLATTEYWTLRSDSKCSMCTGESKKACEKTSLDCGSFDYLRNCVYAAHGYSFKKAKWKRTFEKKSWYKENGMCQHE